MRVRLIVLALLFAIGSRPAPAAVTFWTTGKALMPGWGLYPNGQEYGGTHSLDEYSAWRKGILTWVTEFPAAGEYAVFVRRYAGYGRVKITIDERTPVTGGAGWLDQAANNCYRWEHCGRVQVTPGRHHVDLDIEGMFDAIVFTTDTALNPSKDPLPEPVKRPVLRAPRAYRDDSHLTGSAARRGFVIASVPPDAELLNDYVPATNQVLTAVKLWGAANQYINGAFCVRALQETSPLAMTLPQLVGPNQTRLGTAALDLRVVQLRQRSLNLFGPAVPATWLPDLLLRDDRTGVPPRGRQGGYGGGRCLTAIPAHQSRQFWLTVHVPAGSPAGTYRGRLGLQSSPLRRHTLPVEVEVLPIDLKPVDGYYSIYYPAHPIPPEVRKLDGHVVTPAYYRTALTDQVRHGCNAAILYGDGSTLHFAKEAGTTQPPVLMPWPWSDPQATQTMAQAKALGFPDLYHYGVDEPTGPRIAECRREAEWRLKNGFHMFTAINSHEAWDALKDVVDRPVLTVTVFSGPDNPVVQYARGKGFVPVSYWMTATHYPLWYRAFAGLYNTRCGYLGAAPWSYQDFSDQRVFDPDADYLQAVAYPDEFGQPIPSLAWEAFRAGVDDVRYLQALDRAIAAAEKQLAGLGAPAGLAAAVTTARAVRQARLESISGRYFEYLLALQPSDLDNARWALAQAAMAIETASR